MGDLFVKQARRSWLCRRAFELLETNNRFRLPAAGVTVIECGATSGSCNRVAVLRTNALVGGQGVHAESCNQLYERDVLAEIRSRHDFRSTII